MGDASQIVSRVRHPGKTNSLAGSAETERSRTSQGCAIDGEHGYVQTVRAKCAQMELEGSWPKAAAAVSVTTILESKSGTSGSRVIMILAIRDHSQG